MKPIEYRGSITREQFMFYETRIVAKKILEDKSEEETVKEIVDDNLFQFPTEKNIKSIATGCYRKLQSTDNRNLVALVADASADIGKQAALYALMCYNAVVYDFMVEVIGVPLEGGDDGLGDVLGGGGVDAGAHDAVTSWSMVGWIDSILRCPFLTSQ